MTELIVRELQVKLEKKLIVNDVYIDLSVGQWICIIGPNGAGKSSLLKALAGIIPSTGEILIDGTNVRDLSERDRACWIAYVAQEPVMPAGMRVFDYVLLGRTAHLKMLATESPKDLEIAHYVISELDLNDFIDRDVATLSGGERQRVAIGRALTQASPIILLDEPTTALDVGYQQEVLELIDKLRKEKKIAVISTMHDLTVSGLYPDRLMLLADGQVVASGSAESVLTRENIAKHYGANVTVIDHVSGPIVIPERDRL
ncbi:MAG: ABC transporter ATP-binding protein [Actinobacteria bacterium]|jgi:iron complex transport system ATP-binding protein|nr:ABC transporter ATP-binding protein [Actinomycetota bacterium]